MKVDDMQMVSLPGHSTEAGHTLAQSATVVAMADQSSKVRDAAKCLLGATEAAMSLRKSARNAFQQVLLSAAAEEIHMATGRGVSRNVVKTHYSAAELAAMRLPGMPKTKGKLLAKATRESWSYVEIKGIGGTRREYAPPPAVMAAIKEVIVQRIISGEEHEETDAVENVCGEAARPPVKNGRDAQNAAGATDGRQGALRAVAVLPRPQQSAQPAKHGQALLPQGVDGSAGHGLAQVGALKDWQKRTAEARAALLREVDRIAQAVGREKAIMKVVIMAQEGTLPEHLARLVPVANARAGRDGKRTLSRRTLYKWAGSYTPGVVGVNALAPKDQHAAVRIPAWAADLLAEYQRPQKPSLAWAVEQIAGKHGIDPDALYHRARRFLGKMGVVELQAGRMGTRDIKNIKPFVRRDSSMLWPAEVYTADGHTFDAEVAHPAHGKPFRPEVTTVIDVATRRAVGWSVDLAESGLAVLDALRHACETGGIPSLFYVDNGSGYKNAMMSQPGIGMESRLGFTMTHSIAYNSQARGVIERAHQTLWVRAAKELPTYIGAVMDAQAKQKVHKLTRREVALVGRSKYLLPFSDFVAFCNDKIDAYNNRPHKSLPMAFDAQLGRKRNMTPNEAWQQGVKDGAQLVTVTSDEARELFRPQRECKVIRCEIRLFGNLYFSRDLEQYHGHIVRVAYDIHNGETVWVYDTQGRFVCSAGFEANKRAYFPESFLDMAARKRAAGRAGRLEAKLDEVRQELEGTPLKDVTEAYPTLENNASPTLQLIGNLGGRQEATAIEVVAEDVELTDAYQEEQRRPIFLLESDRYEWLMQHREAWTEGDRQFLTQFARSDIYDALRERFDALGLAWSGEEEVLKVAV